MCVCVLLSAVLQCVAVVGREYTVSQCVRCSVCVAVCYSVLQCVIVGCSVLHCSVLQLWGENILCCSVFVAVCVAVCVLQ